MEEQRLLKLVDQIFSVSPDKPQTTSQNLQALNKALQKASESTLQADSNLISEFEAQEKQDLLSKLEAQEKFFMDFDCMHFNRHGEILVEVPENHIISNSAIKIQSQCTMDSESSKSAQTEQGGGEENDSDKSLRGNNKRTKERKVGVIIEKVDQWRNLYDGAPNSNGEIVRLTLEEAATRVGISKKSLDGYLLLLRFGRKYGFNFEEHKNDKVRLLRAFVKKFKKIDLDLSNIMPGESIPSDLKQQIREKGTPLCKSKKCCVPPSGILKIPGLSLN